MGGGVALDGIGSARSLYVQRGCVWRERGSFPYSTVRDPVRAVGNVNIGVSRVCVCVCVCVSVTCVCVGVLELSK